jgi:hypothetical protein
MLPKDEPRRLPDSVHRLPEVDNHRERKWWEERRENDLHLLSDPSELATDRRWRRLTVGLIV